MPSKIKRSQIQLTDLVSTTLATDASGNIIAGSAGGDMLKSENLSGLANNATARSNIGLGNVDNTSDANKPVSTAQATAIGLKKTDSMATNKLLGRSTAGTGAIEEITLGTNLTLTAGVLDATGGGGGSPFATDIVVNSVTVGKGNNSLAANVVLGDSALSSATTGSLNTAVGSSTLNALTTGTKNVAVGNGALAVVTTGSQNVAVGESASLLGNGSDNTAIGFESLKSNQANGSTAVGSAALKSNTTGIRNNAIGVSALTSNTTGSNNIANGVESLQLNTTGSSNNAMGYQSLQNNTTGDFNIAIGSYSLYQNTTGSNNVATGILALGNGNGSDNTANGTNALVNASSSSNTAVGRLAGATVSSGDSNTLIGKEADVSTGTISNSTAVGRGAIATSSNQVVIGNASVTQTTLRGAVTATSFNGVALTTGGGTTNFLRADGTYAAPGGGFDAGCLLTSSFHSITTGGSVILFTTEAYDTNSYHDNTTNTSRITIPSGKAGKYTFTGAFRTTGGANSYLFSLQKNGIMIQENRFYSAASAFFGAGNCIVVDDLAIVGDYYELFIRCDSAVGADTIRFSCKQYGA